MVRSSLLLQMPQNTLLRISELNLPMQDKEGIFYKHTNAMTILKQKHYIS